jgi:uncharacterized repeat protein (TIGR01451 family)
LLLLPITAGTNTQLPVSLSLPLGAEIVYATGGLTITKTASPTPTVNQGGTLAYDLVIRNDTPFSLTQVVVTDTVPANTQCIFMPDPPAGWLFSGTTSCQQNNLAFWNLQPPNAGFGGFITAGTSITLSYVVAVNQPLPDLTQIVNAASSYGVRAATPSNFTDSGAENINTTVFAPAWEISKIVDPSPTVEPGDSLTYTLTVTNNGHLATSGPYTIIDEIPANTNYITGSASPTATFDGTSLTWVLTAPVAINQAINLSYGVTVTRPLTDNIEIRNDTYSVSGGNVFSPAIGAPVTVTVDAPVTLTLVKADDPDPVQAGDLINYTLILTNDNSSKGPASNVVVTDALPANTTLVDAGFIGPASGITTTAGSVITWTITNPDTLPVGQATTLFMIVRVASPLPNNTIITNDIYNASASNGVVTVLGQPVVTTTVNSTPTLEIFKVGLPEPVEAGGQLTYTIHYTNSGNADATNVLIDDVFPLSTTFNSEDSNPIIHPGSATPNGRQWNINLLAGNGGVGVITLTLNVDAPQNSGTQLTNVVSISSSEVIVPVSFTATNTISSSPRLHIVKFDDPDPVAVGSFLTYTLVFSNDGNADAIGAVITDDLDSGVSFNGASGGGTLNGNEVNWSNLNVPANGLDQTLLFSVTVAPTLPHNSLLTNNVQIVSGNVVATDSITTLVQAPSLTITKVVSPTGIIRAGDTIEYTIIYTNTGAVDITPPGILITDTFPVSVTNIVSGTTGAILVADSPPDLVWSDANLPANGGSGIITITGQVITSPWASSGGQINNGVIVAGNGYSATNSVGIQGRPGLPVTMTVIPLPPTTPVGTNILVGVQAQDIYGNDIFDGTPITLTTSLAGSRLNGSGAPLIINSSGGGITATLSSTVAGTTTLTGQVAGASGILTQTAVATFTPGAVVSFTLQATTPQTAGITFPITITAIDNFGNRVTSANNTITISDTTGTIAPTSVALINGGRIFSFTVFSATSPALDRITAISGTITGTVDVEILPNVPANLTLLLNPTSIQVCGTANVTTTVTDAFGNNRPGDPVTLGVTPLPALVTLSPSAGAIGSSGVFTSLLTGNAAGSQNVTAQSGSLNDSAGITINNPPIPTTMTLTVAPNPLATGGNTALVTATVSDCNGFSAGQTITFTVSNPGLASLPANPTIATTNSSGVATTTLTSNSIPQDGTVIITATTGTLTRTVSVILQTPALTITKTASPASGTEVRPGNIINYTLRVTNTGSGPASNVVMTDVLPAGVSFASCTSTSGATCSGGSTTTVTTPTLNAGQAFTANIQVAVTAATSGTILSNTANIRSSQTPLITSNLVAHSVTTASLDIFLPIIFKNFAASPDLIGSFSLSPANPSAGQPVVVTVVITNVGNGATGDGFWVDFYINPNPVPTVGNQRWDKLGSTVTPKQGIAWVIPASGLAPGASLTLTSNGVGGLAPSAPHTVWSGNFVGGTQDLFVYVDSFSLNASPNGGIIESNESNNRSELHFINPLAGQGQIDLSSLPDPAALPPRWDP